MDHPKTVIQTSVHFHSEIPLIIFAGTMNLRVAIAFAVLGPTRCGDNAGSDNTAFAQYQTPTIIAQGLDMAYGLEPDQALYWLRQLLAQPYLYQQAV